MKKILSIVIMLIISFQTFITVNANSDIGFSTDTQVVYVEGVIDEAGKDVSILMTDSQNNVMYINQYETDNEGKYKAKFELYDDIVNYSVMVREGTKDVTDSIKVAYATVPTAFSFVVRDSDYSSRIDEGELAKALIQIDNKYGKNGTFVLGLACYGENNKLLKCNFTDLVNYGFNDIAMEFEKDFTDKIPEGTKKITGFLWNNLVGMNPLSGAYKRDAGDGTFGAESDVLTVALIGDSITHLANYIAPVEHYYQTRYPGRTVNFVNKGISGDTASGVIGRYDWDITMDKYTGNIDEALMMIGMNDVGGSVVYPEDLYGIKDSNIENSLKNIEEIIKKCVSDRISLTLVTPSAYDETDEFDTTITNTEGKNSYGLNKIQQGVKELGAKYDVPVVDLWTPTTELINNQRSLGNTGTVITGTDRIHPDKNGGFFMGYQIVKQQDEGSVVSSVEIDANTKSIKSENADAKIVSANETAVSYSYLPYSLPLAYTEEYKNTEQTWGYNVTDEINREIIKVTNLENGNYEVKIDDNVLGDYTADLLSNGINIATNAKNPGQAQSMLAYEKTAKKVSVESDYRGLAFTEYTMKKNNVYTLEELQPLANASHFTYYFSPYFGSDVFTYRVKANQNQTWDLIKSLEKEARELSVPVEHTVTITKK